MKILCLHGINTDENANTQNYWFSQWQKSIQQQLPGVASRNFSEFPYNQYFNVTGSTPGQYFSALGQAFGNFFKSLAPLSRGPQDVNPGSVSMVAKWLGADGLRPLLRTQLAQQIQADQPELIIAYSLGSLILYDTLLEDPSLASGRVLITLGSQISHPTVCGEWISGVRMIDTARHCVCLLVSA